MVTGWYGQALEFRREGRQWAGPVIVPADGEPGGGCLAYEPTPHLYGPLLTHPGRLGVLERLDIKARRDALEAGHGAEFGGTSGGECIGYLPHVRLSPGPRGVRSVTMHAASWDELLSALEELVVPTGSDGPDTG